MRVCQVVMKELGMVAAICGGVLEGICALYAVRKWWCVLRDKVAYLAEDVSCDGDELLVSRLFIDRN